MGVLFTVVSLPYFGVSRQVCLPSRPQPGTGQAARRLTRLLVKNWQVGSISPARLCAAAVFCIQRWGLADSRNLHSDYYFPSGMSLRRSKGKFSQISWMLVAPTFPSEGHIAWLWELVLRNHSAHGVIWLGFECRGPGDPTLSEP